MELGDYVRLLRTQRHWTQEDLADFAGMQQNHISAIELGNRRSISAATASKLAAALGVSLDDFQLRRVPVMEGWPQEEVDTQGEVERAIGELAASNPRLARLIRLALDLPEEWRDDVFGVIETQLALIASLPKR